MDQLVVAVAVFRPLFNYFHYLAPQEARVGMRVAIPFGNTQTLGIIAKIDSTHAVPKGIVLRNITRLLDKQPLLDGSLWQLLTFAARYYQTPIGEVAQAAIPKLLLHGGDNRDVLDKRFALTAQGRQQLKSNNGSKQKAVLEALMHVETLSYSQLKESFNLTRAWLEDLCRRGWLQQQSYYHQEVTAKVAAPILNDEQRAACAQLKLQQKFTVSLLDGVTGSGKTEIFIRHIEHVHNNGGQVLLIVPEIGLVNTMVTRLRARLDCVVAAHHSALSERARLASWQAMNSMAAQVLVGTRSAIFVRFFNLAAIIVDEEHDLSYKQQDSFCYHGRDLAIMRAKQLDIPIILASATPSLQSYHHVFNGQWQWLKLTQRPLQLQRAHFEIENISNAKMIGGLSTRLIAAIRATLKERKQVMLFLNRRGYAPILRCDDCGWQSVCNACDALMCAHLLRGKLLCHHCLRSEALPSYCGNCGSYQLRFIGMGTQRLEQTLRQQFPAATILRIDSDTHQNVHDFNEALRQISAREVDIILGTQWLSKGHHFPFLHLVAIVDADQAFYSVDFRAEERLAQLLVQVGGRAGREGCGLIWVQSKQIGQRVFTVLNAPYEQFARLIYSERQAIGLPPCVAQVNLQARSKNEKQVVELLDNCKSFLQREGIFEYLQVFGPLAAQMMRKDGYYRYNLLLQAPQKKQLQHHLPLIVNYLLLNNKKARVQFNIDVDPQILV